MREFWEFLRHGSWSDFAREWWSYLLAGDVWSIFLTVLAVACLLLYIAAYTPRGRRWRRDYIARYEADVAARKAHAARLEAGPQRLMPLDDERRPRP